MNSEAQAVKARTMHALGMKWGKSCIDCHQGIVHSLPQGFDKEAVMDELHDRMEKEKVDCRPCHEGMAGPPPGEGWD
jgi:nitrate/TMAO reductase-like tetraheme cytochrome c subunit